MGENFGLRVANFGIAGDDRFPGLPVFRSTGFPVYRFTDLPINITEHDVDRANDGDNVREEVAFGQHLGNVQIGETGRANAKTVGMSTAILDKIEAHLTFRSFDAAVNFTF